MSRILPIGWMQLYVLIQWASCERNFLSCFDQCTHYGLHSLWEKFSLLRYRATAYSMMKLHEYSKVTTLFLRVIVRATETSSWPKNHFSVKWTVRLFVFWNWNTFRDKIEQCATYFMISMKVRLNCSILILWHSHKFQALFLVSVL